MMKLRKIAKLEDKVKNLNEQLKEEQMRYLSLKDDMECNISTFSNGKYTDNVRQCIMSLLSLGVSTKRVDPVIRTVLHLADKSVGRLPSATTVKEMVIEAGIVSKLQLSEILPLTEFNTLHTDGTTKYGEKYGAFEVSTTEGSYSLALCEMKSGSSTESLDVLNTIIEEIDEISESAGLDAAGRKIIITIKNTMSDRHSAEKKFNELLEDYRTKVLSEVVDNWEGMSEEEQTGIMKLNNFFCGLHFMVALADCASEALLEAERCLLEKGEKVGAQKVAPAFVK